MSCRILIADDHEDIRELLRIILTKASFTVVVANDGDHALELWRRERDEGLCAVILDQRMPGLSGIEVALAIRADNPHQIVMLLSAHLDDEVVARAAEAGIAACVSKEQILDVPRHEVLRNACGS